MQVGRFLRLFVALVAQQVLPPVLRLGTRQYGGKTQQTDTLANLDGIDVYGNGNFV